MLILLMDHLLSRMDLKLEDPSGSQWGTVDV